MPLTLPHDVFRLFEDAHRGWVPSHDLTLEGLNHRFTFLAASRGEDAMPLRKKGFLTLAVFHCQAEAVAPAAPTSSTLSRLVCFGKDVPVRIRCHRVWIGSTQVDIRFPWPNGEENFCGSTAYSFTFFSFFPTHILTAQTKSNRMTN